MNSNFFSYSISVLQIYLGLACVFYTSGFAGAKDFLGQASLIEVLPESTQLLFTSQNVRNSYTALERSDICKQLSGPVWQSVLAKQRAAKTGSLLNPQPWLGLDWQDIKGIDQVGAVAAFLDDKGDTALVFLASLGKNAENHPFVQRWIASKGGMSRFQSVALNEATKLYSLPTDEKTNTAVCIAFGSQWTCISSSSTAVMQWLGSPTKKSMQASPGSQYPVFGTDKWGNGETRYWLSPWGILSGYTAKKDPKLFRSASLFGLQGLGALSGTIVPPSNAENAWRLSYSQQLASPPAKGLGVLSFKTGPLAEPPKILNTAMDQVTISYVDMKPWFQGVSHAIDQMIDEETPGNFADLVDSILTDPEGPKIDVRKELIYPSGPLMFQFSATLPDKKNPAQFQRNHVWACSLQDAKKASTTINKLFENDKEVVSEQIGAYKVWNTVNDESLFVAITKGENQAVSAAAIDTNFLYLSTDTKWLKGLLAGTVAAPDSNRKRPALWQSHLQKMQTPLFSLRQGIDLGSWLERSWARLPEPTEKEFSVIDLPSFFFTSVLVPGIAAEDVPKWSQVRSTFGVLTHSATQNERGIDGQIWLYSTP